jgi:hypothetical protein
MGYFRMLAAIPGFFLSAYFFMLLWGVFAPNIAVYNISYVNSMLITFALWVAVAPLAAVGRRRK